MKAFILLFSFMFLFGCATTSEKIMLPEGDYGYAIRCESARRKCLKEAASLCPAGYKISSETSTAGLLDPVYDMVIRCKNGGVKF